MRRGALRFVLLALLGALLAGFVAGTLIRMRLERPVRYLGRLDATPALAPGRRACKLVLALDA